MSGNVEYPIGLANGRLARLLLPSDLTRADVARIVAMLQTLPTPPPAAKICTCGYEPDENCPAHKTEPEP